jgi:hypothetical protein
VATLVSVAVFAVLLGVVVMGCAVIGIRAIRSTSRASGPSDLRRADDAQLDGPYDPGAASQAALDSFGRFAPPDQI